MSWDNSVNRKHHYIHQASSLQWLNLTLKAAWIAVNSPVAFKNINKNSPPDFSITTHLCFFSFQEMSPSTFPKVYQVISYLKPHWETDPLWSGLRISFKRCSFWKQLLFSCSVVSNSLRPHGLQHARLSYPSLSPQTYVHWVGDAIQPSHPLSSPSPPAPNPSQHQGLFQWASSSHQVARVLKLQLWKQLKVCKHGGLPRNKHYCIFRRLGPFIFR